MSTIHDLPKYPKAVGPYSPYYKAGNLLFCSGQIALDPETMRLVKGGTTDEAIQIIRNISGILKENGLDFKNVVKTTIFLTNINDFKLVNEIYGEYFSHKPARSTIEVSKLPLGAKIEIEVIAII